MFRRTKPRATASQNRIRRRIDNDDDDEEDASPATIVKRKPSMSSKKRTVVRKTAPFATDSQVMSTAEQPEPADSFQASATTYGQDVLAQLRAEQHQRQPTPATSGASKPASSFVISTAFLTSEDPLMTKDFIPVQEESNNNPILTGDDALQASQGSSMFSLDDNEEERVLMMKSNNTDDSPENMEWEAQVARRGIRSNNSTQPSPYQYAYSSSNQDPVIYRSLQEQQQVVQKAIQQLQQQNQNNRTAERRQEQVKQVEEELQQYQRDLHLAGTAHEYFQQLRHRLAQWVGALRDLQVKLLPLQDALFQVQARVASNPEWVEWQDCVCVALHQANCLERVVGRQPLLGMPGSLPENVVDEFGRHVPSQQFLQQLEQLRKWKARHH